MIAGIGGGSRNSGAALADGGRLVGVCPQERAIRLRNAGVNDTRLPDEALDLLLERLGRSRDEIARYVVADCAAASVSNPAFERLEHSLAHACTAYLTSPFSSSAILVCDQDGPEVTVWMGEGPDIRPFEWRWEGPGFHRTFSRFSAALGFRGAAADVRMEALARLHPDSRDQAVDRMIRWDGEGIAVDPDFERVVAEMLRGDSDLGSPRRARLASSLQARLGELLVEFLRQVRARTLATRLCLGGTLFYHSSMNTTVRESGLFTDVFFPVDPGDSGLSVGAALHGGGAAPARVSPFLGPSYSAEEIKQVLDNCKLRYSWESEEGAVVAAVKALQEGRLVAWFDGAMEWGPRALGARCILASPSAPYVLENLNHFLKRREPWRGYALSGLQEATSTHFTGPEAAPFMECDYRPRDTARFRAVLPSTESTVRVQTVSADDGLPRFRRLLEAFGDATGLPFLVNTSFNGFHEPIVCSPRDAVRVFYGTGLDVLVIDQFVLQK